MGKRNGTWSPIYGQAWTHHKTATAAAWLVKHGRRITAAVAPFLILGWLNRLNLWCLANSEHGSLAGLSHARVATIAWPEAIEDGAVAQKAGESILGALRAGGFVEGEPPRVHEFDAFHAGILHNRRTHLDPEHQRAAGRGSAASRKSKYGSAQPNHHPNHDGSGDGSDDGNHHGSNHPEPSVTVPVTVSVPTRADGSDQGPECGFATTTTSPPPQPSEPSGLGRSRRQDHGLPDQADDAPHDPPQADAAELGRLAHSLELRIDCPYVQAWKQVQILHGWGMTVTEIRAAIDATPGGKQAPWTWAEHVHRQHRDAKAGHIA